MSSRRRARYLWTFALSARTSPSAACSSGSVAVQASRISMCAKTCSPCCGPLLQDGLPIAGRSSSNPARSIPATIRSVFCMGQTKRRALYAWQRALRILNSVPAEAVRSKSIRMTTRLLESARSRGWRVNTAENPAERGGTVSVDCPHAFEVCRELLAREILVDYRPQAGIRISPHFYNREEECDFVLSQIEEILNSRAWEKHALAASQA